MAREVLYLIEGVSKDYRMGEVTVRALREVSMEIYAGEFLVVLGPSGCGKSTLLNLVGGMDVPSGGSIRFQDVDVAGFSRSALTRYRRQSVGFVFQFFNLIPTLTALENVQIATEITDEPLDALEMLGLVGLGDRAHHFPSQLSGGEQQRVAIARAIAKNPYVVLCDEPTGALDYETGKLVLEVLRRVHRHSGKTVVVVTHNSAIGRMADRVVRLRSGTIQHISVNERPEEPEDLQW